MKAEFLEVTTSGTATGREESPLLEVVGTARALLVPTKE